MDIIRSFYETDLKAVMKIWYEGNLEVHDFINKEYWERNFGYVSRRIPKVEMYVYEVDGEVVGFIGYDDDEKYLEGIFIKPDFRGFGIGGRLMKYIKDKYDYFTLHVFEKNERAIHFYDKMGLVLEEKEVNEDLGEVEYRMYYERPLEENEIDSDRFR